MNGFENFDLGDNNDDEVFADKNIFWERRKFSNLTRFIMWIAPSVKFRVNIFKLYNCRRYENQTLRYSRYYPVELV
jgi:hypothetical protein